VGVCVVDMMAESNPPERFTGIPTAQMPREGVGTGDDMENSGGQQQVQRSRIRISAILVGLNVRGIASQYSFTAVSAYYKKTKYWAVYLIQLYCFFFLFHISV
jgi:hypothetical protein